MSKLKPMVAWCLIVSFVVVSGCASIVSKSDYPVDFSSSPEGAKVSITDKNGNPVYTGKTPTHVNLKSGAGFFSGAQYNVTFEKDDCETQTMLLDKELDGWYLGNILFGGLIGLLLVDPATGAMWKLPPNMHASLAQKAGTQLQQDSPITPPPSDIFRD